MRKLPKTNDGEAKPGKDESDEHKLSRSYYYDDAHGYENYVEDELPEIADDTEHIESIKNDRQARIDAAKEKVLHDIQLRFQLKLEQGNKLLENIKDRRTELESLRNAFIRAEADFVYRFYHQSFKVFGVTQLISLARKEFEGLAPDSVALNAWYCLIADKAVAKSFDSSKTNQNWLEETRPILEAFWHSKYFVEQMLVAADELDTAPEILPSGWAAVLYLYNLR